VEGKQPSQEVLAVVKQVVVKHVRTACSVHPSFHANQYYCGTWATACLPKLGSFIAGPPTRITVTWVNKENMPHPMVDMNKGFRSKGRQFSVAYATACEQVLDPPEHEGQSHRQAGQLTFSLSGVGRLRPNPARARPAPVRIGNLSCARFLAENWMRRIRWLANCVSTFGRGNPRVE
jgi:hypothetical protein